MIRSNSCSTIMTFLILFVLFSFSLAFSPSDIIGELSQAVNEARKSTFLLNSPKPATPTTPASPPATPLPASPPHTPLVSSQPTPANPVAPSTSAVHGSEPASVAGALQSQAPPLTPSTASVHAGGNSVSPNALTSRQLSEDTNAASSVAATSR